MADYSPPIKELEKLEKLEDERMVNLIANIEEQIEVKGIAVVLAEILKNPNMYKLRYSSKQEKDIADRL